MTDELFCIEAECASANPPPEYPYQVPEDCPTNAHGIIAVNDEGKGMIMTMLTYLHDYLQELLEEDLPEGDFDVIPGLYYFRLSTFMDGDGWEHEYSLETEISILKPATIADLHQALIFKGEKL